MTEESMLDALKRGGYGNCRAYLLRFVRDMQRRFCLLHSPGCPMTHHNLFDELCIALEEMDSDSVEQVMSIQVSEMIENLGESIIILKRLGNVFDALPEIWGGDALGEGEE